MGPKQYGFAATQAALVGMVFSLPGKHTRKRGWYSPRSFRLSANPSALLANLFLGSYCQFP